ncbi:hypothetical protein ACH79_35560 [Bradyrhizobium sp. CCBAU 051011]|jgi:hypothetical protein|uniref:hypothetical protein n=1 Tax=Bradyrhizobium sp. CCBAU 051011 TaxID=858422 RepID=UPI0013743632|nr:hypothetical protein [Bradyrhizobium sp. CCBAU 051011]QHO77174.1 hypothetical protein ACH79_35560 [Bradyrhizobium sp. CCBAU 051011]
MAGEIFSLIRMPIIAFLGGFLVVGGWIWAPKISDLVKSQFSGGPSVSMFADTNRIGRPETAPVVRSCIFKAVDVGPDASKMEPSAAYFILKAGSMQANISAMAGKSDRWSENQTINQANSWGQLASCIYALDDRELCDPDNRAAAVEATTKFFAYAKQTAGSTGKPAISADDARAIENIRDRLLLMLKNHRRYGTLVAADFGSFAPAEIMQVMRSEQKETRDICKR